MTDRSCLQELAAGKCVSKLKCSQRHAATAGNRPGNVSNSGMRLKTRIPCSHHGGPVTATPHEHDCPIHFQLAIPKSPAASNTQHQGLDVREMFDILIFFFAKWKQKWPSAQHCLSDVGSVCRVIATGSPIRGCIQSDILSSHSDTQLRSARHFRTKEAQRP